MIHNDITLRAGQVRQEYEPAVQYRSLGLQGSTVVSDQQTTLIAKNHLTLQSATEEQQNQLWEMGGKGRILMSALTMAAGGNVAGSTGQMLQAATINVIQSYGAQQIKLLADSMNSEVARTALQGLLAGAGAAAQGQSATSAALGASASVVLNNLIDSAYGESSRTLSLAEREARKNLVTSLISGTTHAFGGEAALANTAAAIEVENNSMGGMMSAGINLGIAMNPNLSVKEKADLYQVMAANELEMAALLGGLPCLVTRNLVYDLQALRQGETTLADIAQQRGVEYVTGTLVTAMTMTGLNLVYQQGKLVIAPIAQNIQHSVAIQQSKRLAYTALSKAGINLRPSTAPTNVALKGQQLVGAIKKIKSAASSVSKNSKAINKTASTLNKASKASFNSIENINEWIPKEKHMFGTTAKRAAQFNTNDIENIRNLVKEALASPDAKFMTNNVDGSFRVVIDTGRIIGTKGQTGIRIIIGSEGKLWNAFPVNIQ